MIAGAVAGPPKPSLGLGPATLVAALGSGLRSAPAAGPSSKLKQIAQRGPAGLRAGNNLLGFTVGNSYTNRANKQATGRWLAQRAPLTSSWIPPPRPERQKAAG